MVALITDEGAQRGAADHGHFPGQRLEDGAHVAAVGDEHPEHATEHDDPTDDDEHGVASDNDPRGRTALDGDCPLYRHLRGNVEPAGAGMR
jgi:hypothetical protein